MICSLADCSFEDAKKAFEQTGNVVDAVDMLLGKGCDKTVKPKVKKELTDVQKELERIRMITKEADDRTIISLGQHATSVSVEKQDHHVETALQNNCSQKCQIPSLE